MSSCQEKVQSEDLKTKMQHSGILWNAGAVSWGGGYKNLRSLVAQTVKNPPAIWETWVQSLVWEDSLAKGMATHSSILAWRIPWTEELGRLQSMRSQRLRYSWVTKHTHTHTHTHTPVKTHRNKSEFYICQFLKTNKPTQWFSFPHSKPWWKWTAVSTQKVRESIKIYRVPRLYKNTRLYPCGGNSLSIHIAASVS